MAPINPGESVVVMELGVTGQLHVQLAKSACAGSVVGMTRSAWKCDLAEELGADAAWEPGEGGRERVLEMTGGRGRRSRCRNIGPARHLGSGHRLGPHRRVHPAFRHLYGNGSGVVVLPALFQGTADSQRARRQGGDYAPSIDLVRSGAVRLRPLVSHEMPLEDLAKALGVLESRDDRSMKTILEH
jgi:threonine dehydrogenase-like Zn-dependent dehydrogenase